MSGGGGPGGSGPVLRPAGGGNGVGRWLGASRAGWIALFLGGATLLQILLGAGKIDRYRLTLLGYRFGPAAAERDAGITVGGDHGSADLHVPGSGEAPVARLRLSPEDTSAIVRAEEDGTGLVAVRGPDERDWRFLGARPLTAGDTVVLRMPQGTIRLVVDGADGVRAVGRGARVELPPYPRSGVRAWLLGRLGLPRRPSPWQVTYPLADVLATMEGAEGGSSSLSSFLFFGEPPEAGGILPGPFRRRLMVMDLDGEVEVRSGSGAPAPAGEVALEDGSRLLVAGLPFRDYPELDLRGPERRGIRPLASFRIDVAPGHVDIHPTRPEVVLTRPPDTDAGTWTLRLAHARNPAAREAVVLTSPSERFAPLAEAVLELPTDPDAGAVRVRAPEGRATWELGEPFPLGEGGARSLLLRVDGQGMTWRLGILLTLLVLLGGGAFFLRPRAAPIFPLALAGFGLSLLRLVLAFGGHLDPPYLQEGYRLGLWIPVVVPWTLIGLWEAGAGLRHGGAGDDAHPGIGAGRDPGAGRHRATGGGPGIHRPDPPGGQPRAAVAYGLFLGGAAFLGVGLFEGARRLVAVAVPTAVALLVVGGRRLAPRLRAAFASREATPSARDDAPVPPDGTAIDGTSTTIGSRLGGALREGWSRLGFPGLFLGGLLLAVRTAFAVAGFKEAILGEPRVSFALVYTPAALLLLAAVLVRHDRGVRAAPPDAVAGAVFRAAADAVLFSLLAFAGAALVASDFGIALVGLPGVFVALLLVGARWTRTVPGAGRYALALMAAPLVLFAAVQVTPRLVSGVWELGVIEEDVRMREWNRNQLLLLERADFETLRFIGQRRSEALAVMRETMRAYTRGNWTGHGFLEGEVSAEIAGTAAREHTVGAMLAAQWGLAGVMVLLLLLAAHLTPVFGLRGGTLRMRPGAAALCVLLPFAVLVLIGALAPRVAVTPLAGAAGTAALAAAAWWAFLREPTEHLDPAPGSASVPAPGSAAVPAPGSATTADPAPGSAAVPAPGSATTADPAPGSAAAPAPEAPPAGRPRPLRFPGLAATLLLLTLVFGSLYMVLANYGLVFFTGKNVYLLGLDSLSDTLEYLTLAGLAAGFLGWRGARRARDREEGGPDGGEGTRADPSPESRSAPAVPVPGGAAGPAGLVTDGGRP